MSTLSIKPQAGLVLLLFEKSTQAQFLIPMANSLGFDIFFASLIPLFIVSVDYSILEDIKRYCRRYGNDLRSLWAKNAGST
jgi:hypothetical protein